MNSLISIEIILPLSVFHHLYICLISLSFYGHFHLHFHQFLSLCESLTSGFLSIFPYPAIEFGVELRKNTRYCQSLQPLLMYFYCHIISLHFFNSIILSLPSYFYPSTFFFKSLHRCTKLSSSFIFSIKCCCLCDETLSLPFPAFLVQRLYKKNHGSRNNFLAMISPFRYNFHSYGFFFSLPHADFALFKRFNITNENLTLSLFSLESFPSLLASSKYLNRSGD